MVKTILCDFTGKLFSLPKPQISHLLMGIIIPHRKNEIVHMKARVNSMVLYKY